MIKNMPRGKPQSVAEQIADEIFEMLTKQALEIRSSVKTQVETLLAKKLGLPHGEEVMEDYVGKLIENAQTDVKILSKKRSRHFEDEDLHPNEPENLEEENEEEPEELDFENPSFISPELEDDLEIAD